MHVAGAIEELLGDQLGAERIVWLGNGLIEDRDTDGHVDLIAAFTPTGKVLLQTVPETTPTTPTARRTESGSTPPGSP